MDDMRTLIALNDELTDAELRGDRERMNALLDKHLRFRRGDGETVDLEHFLSALGSPGYKNELLEAEIESLEVIQDQAVVIAAVRFRGKRNGAPLEGVFRNVCLFDRTAEGWRLAMWFNKRVGDL
jgi:hypothetical protein